MNLRSLFLAPLLLLVLPATAQKTYSVTLLELIFAFNQSEFTESFRQAYPEASIMEEQLRFTGFCHFEQDWHLDLNENIGFFTGLGVRNIGMITDEVLPASPGGVNTVDYKIIRRVYTLGVPLALKLGSFKNHIYIYGGGEIEFAFHFKEKYWTGIHDRSGVKTKYSEWFGEQTPVFLPSLLAGIQFPGGFNLRVKYYYEDFLNNEYLRSSTPDIYNVSDLSRYKTTQVFYFSISWQFNKAYQKLTKWQGESTVADLNNNVN